MSTKLDTARVKQLRWEQDGCDENSLWARIDNINRYYSIKPGSNVFAVESCLYRNEWGGERLGLFGTLEAAKAAAQQDFATRIRSSLAALPPPTGEPNEFIGRCSHCLDNAYTQGRCASMSDPDCLIRRALAAPLQVEPAEGEIAAGWSLISDRHFYALASALSEIKATNDGQSDQPISQIVEWCMAEIKASPPPKQGFALTSQSAELLSLRRKVEETERLPFSHDRRAQAAVLADLPESVAREAGNFYESYGAAHDYEISKAACMAEAWSGVLRPYLIGLRDHHKPQERPEISDANGREAALHGRAENRPTPAGPSEQGARDGEGTPAGSGTAEDHADDEHNSAADGLEAAHQEFRLQNDREWREKLDHANHRATSAERTAEEMRKALEYGTVNGLLNAAIRAAEERVEGYSQPTQLSEALTEWSGVIARALAGDRP